jgi:aspartyl-tRNA(Asn)/glutamyl-tRNA(Gln) amidotransferase subunit C
MGDKITEEEVKKVASLARLGMTEVEIERATQNLRSILGHFAAIQQIDTAGVPTSDDVTGLKNVARVDEAAPENICSADRLLELTPETQGRYVKVKAVFE